MDWSDFRISKRLALSASVVEQVYALLAEIDSVKNSWRATERILPQTIERLTRSVIVTSTGASNRIEGNKLSDKEVEALYKNLKIQSFKTRDEQEVVGYLESLETLFEHYETIPISESTILTLHQNMLKHSDKDSRHKGSYKFGPNRVEAKDARGNIVGVIFDPTPPHLVKKEMQELIEWYQWSLAQKEKHPLLQIANFIFEYLAIHPFQDGNGRTSRLLTNLLLMQQGYRFAAFVSHEQIIESRKLEYYRALNKTQATWKTEAEDISTWVLFFLNVVKTQSQKALKIMEGDAIEHLLSEKQLALWQWINRVETTEFSRRDAAQALGFPERTVESIIKKLVELQKLKKIGQGRATRYQKK